MENTIDIKSHIESLTKNNNLLAGNSKNELKLRNKSSYIQVAEDKYKDIPFYPLAVSTWSDEEKIAIFEQVNTGNYTMGKNVEKFENSFADYFGSKYAVMVNSGSSANLLIIAALTLLEKYDFRSGDEVIVPSLGWSTSYSPFLQYGLKLKFVDINKYTLNLDENKIEEAITKNTKAILGINILGNPIELKKIQEICKRNHLILIEDNCESLGAKYKSKYAGTFGVAGSHSFFFSHHIQTIEGGMITTDDKEIYEYIKSLRAHGWTRDLPIDSKLKNCSTDKFSEAFRFVLPGYNLRPNELNGVVGLCQLRKLKDFLKIRKQNARFFVELFKNESFCSIQNCEEESSWFGFAIILKDKLKDKRSHIVHALKNNGIETRPIVTGNFLKNPVIDYYDYSISGNLINTQIVDDCGFFVGNHHKPLFEQIERLHSTLKKLNKYHL